MDLPDSGIKLTPSALAGGLFTAEPPVTHLQTHICTKTQRQAGCVRPGPGDPTVQTGRPSGQRRFAFCLLVRLILQGFPGGSDGKKSACNVGDPGSIPGSGRSLEKGKAAHSGTLAWRIPWTGEPGGYSPSGHKELNMTEQLTRFTHTVTATHEKVPG